MKSTCGLESRTCHVAFKIPPFLLEDAHFQCLHVTREDVKLHNALHFAQQKLTYAKLVVEISTLFAVCLV